MINRSIDSGLVFEKNNVNPDLDLDKGKKSQSNSNLSICHSITIKHLISIHLIQSNRKDTLVFGIHLIDRTLESPLPIEVLMI